MYAGDVSKAEMIADIIIRLGLRMEEETIATLIAVYGRQHKLKEAKRLYLAAGESKTPGKSVIRSMIDAYVRCGWLEDAYGLFMESAEKGCDPGAVTISILVNALTNRGMSSGKLHFLPSQKTSVKFRDPNNLIYSTRFEIFELKIF